MTEFWTHKDTAEMCAFVIGKTEEDAKLAIESTAIEDRYDRADHLTWRILQRDGKAMLKTNDYKSFRVNLYVMNGVVTGASPG